MHVEEETPLLYHYVDMLFWGEVKRKDIVTCLAL